MGFFSIHGTDFAWIDGSLDDTEDFCLHGHVDVRIGSREIEYDATVSAAALTFLKTLTEDHIMGAEQIQMLPCCGHFMVPDKLLENVTLFGCADGIDWNVTHEGDTVLLEFEDGAKESVPIADYRQAVYAFADQVEAFYKACTPKVLPPDNKLVHLGYLAFWNEWHRRRKG